MQGLVFCLMGAVFFGALGCVSKLAERRNCNPPALVVCAFLWATPIMLLRTSVSSNFSLPWKAVGVALACGICAAVAYLAFQVSIRGGKISVAWLIMNLSAGVPAVVSIWLYSEMLSALKLSALTLVLISLLLLFQGYRLEARRKATAGDKE
jgi:drug/metabolite transporter (DMT)-like permease